MRLSHLNREAAQWRLFSLDEHTEQCEELDLACELNLSTHLVHCFNREHTLERFANSVARMRAFARRWKPWHTAPRPSAFAFTDLEFARATLEPDRHFRMAERMVFGAAPAEYEWNDDTEPLLGS